jgi:hypothetical protein
MTDKPALSGAEFQREVGADPEKWATRFLEAYDAAAATVRSNDDRLAFVTAWFRDAQEAAVKAAGTSWPPQDDNQPDDSDAGMKA